MISFIFHLILSLKNPFQIFYSINHNLFPLHCVAVNSVGQKTGIFKNTETRYIFQRNVVGVCMYILL